MEATYQWYLGIDWATQAHQCCLLDAARRVVEERVVEHSGAAMAGWLAALAARVGGDLDQIAVGIEVPRGPVVDALVERGAHVYALNPKQLDRFRDRHTVAGAKDDRRDAFVLADALATDRGCYRRVMPDDPRVLQLRECSRADEDLRQEANRLTNRLREQLHRYYPQILHLSPAVDEPWIWALLELAPTPASGAQVRLAVLRRLLKTHRLRRITADEVLMILRTPALVVAAGVVPAAVSHLALLVPRLRLVHAQRKTCAVALDKLLSDLTDGEAGPGGGTGVPSDVAILRSCPGVGRVVASTLLAEAARPLAARDYSALRAHTGVAPVTHQSGQRRVAVMRQACNGRLRTACYHWARIAAMVDARARGQYAALRQRGHSHGRALRSVADRLLRIPLAMLRDRTLYDPSRFTAPAPAGGAA